MSFEVSKNIKMKLEKIARTFCGLKKKIVKTLCRKTFVIVAK